MSAGNAASGSADAPNTTRSTLSKKNQAKADKKSTAKSKEFTEFTKDVLNPNDNIQTTNTYNDGGGDGQQNNNTIVNKTVGGTKIQTTEAKVEKAADLTAEQIALRNKKRGRASSIMTSSQGVGKTSSNYELGKTSLLGRV